MLDCTNNLGNIRTVVADIDESVVCGVDLKLSNDIPADARRESSGNSNERYAFGKEGADDSNGGILLSERVAPV